MNLDDKVRLMLSKKIWAVIGANQKKTKYGNMVYRKLKENGYIVYPVNPVYKEVEGDICYNDLTSLPEKPDIINFVVSPKRTKIFLEEAKKLDIKYIWLQPGSYDDEIMKIIEKNEFIAVKACVLVSINLK